MQRNTHATRRGRARRMVRHASFVGRAVLLGAVLGCHPDPTTAPVTPTEPTLAVSSDGTWLVNSLADPGDGACTNSECTLREAIGAAQAGERITFKSNLKGTIALTAGSLIVDKSLTIESLEPSQIVIDAKGGSSVFSIGEGGPGVLARLSGLTITGGDKPKGGGIRVFAGSTLNLIGSIVTGNSAAVGGGIQAEDATIRVVGSTIAGNSATDGGGIQWEVSGATTVGPSLRVVRSTISGNTAKFQGAGILAVCTGASVACSDRNEMVIGSSTITGNETLTFEGGGLVLNGIVVRRSNSIIAGNRNAGGIGDGLADCESLSAAGGFITLGYNLTTAGTGCDGLPDPTDVIVPSTTQVFSVVLRPDLADNGGPTPTHALIERGLAVDAGYCPGENGDQRGFPRPYDDRRMPNALDGCDIGAFEWNPASTKKKP